MARIDETGSIDFLMDAVTAVQRARTETKLLMVFLHGDFDDEAVDEMEETVWKNPDVLAAVSIPALDSIAIAGVINVDVTRVVAQVTQEPGVVALQLNADSTGGQQFAQMYPVGATPCLQLINPPTAQQPGTYFPPLFQRKHPRKHPDLAVSCFFLKDCAVAGGQVVKIIRGTNSDGSEGGVLAAADVAAGISEALALMPADAAASPAIGAEAQVRFAAGVLLSPQRQKKPSFTIPSSTLTHLPLSSLLVLLAMLVLLLAILVNACSANTRSDCLDAGICAYCVFPHVAAVFPASLLI